MTEERIAPPRPVPDALFQFILVAADDPVLSTSEVAELLPIGKRATLNRLHKLRENDYIMGKKVGSKVWIWWGPKHVTIEDIQIKLAPSNYTATTNKEEIKNIRQSPNSKATRWAAIHYSNRK